MGVTIKGMAAKKYRPKASRFSNNDIHEIAPLIIQLQAEGVLIPRDLAARLNTDNVARPSGGRWNVTLIYLILRRGCALGLPFLRHDRSAAASARRVMRRPKCVIEAERARATAHLLALLGAETNPAITSATVIPGSTG